MLTGTVLGTTALAVGIVLLDYLAGPSIVLIGLLAFPPVVAATRASVAETTLVALICSGMSVLSGLWNEFGTTEYLVEVLTTAAGGGAAVWIATLRVNLRREHDAAELLAETGTLLEERLDSEHRAEHLARLVVPDLADASTVDLCGPNGAIVRSATVSVDPVVERAFTELRRRLPIASDGPHPAAVAIRTGEVQMFGELGEEQLAAMATEPRELELMKLASPSSALVVPLKARGTVIGALAMWVFDPSRRHDERAQNAALRLAHRAGLALDNARLHEQQAHIADVLQRSLLPRSLPSIAGFDAASRFFPVGEAHQVGGDFYDAFETSAGNWNVVIGDVCGKGPEAAALTALVRYTVRTASGRESSPSEVLKALHHSILNDRPEVRFCTAALASVSSPANGRDPARLRVALGGHPPPLALRRGGRVDSIGEPGTLLGALPSPVVSEVQTTLAPGESLVLYTDGMLESRDRSMADDPGWLAEQLAGANGATADELAEQLARLAILVLQRRG
jgi:serine phosphatase RsbU (regulator of sigma subunit)